MTLEVPMALLGGWLAVSPSTARLVPSMRWRTGDPAVLAWAPVVNLGFVVAMVPEIRQWLRIRREEKWNDPVELMQLPGMLRGILRMGMALGVVKKQTLRVPRPAVEDDIATRPPAN